MTTAVARRVAIKDGLLCHHPSKRADDSSDFLGGRGPSLTERIEDLPRASEAFVEECVEILLRYGVDGVVIEQVPPQGDIGGGGWDQIPASLRPPDACAARMVCIDFIDPEQYQGAHHRQGKDGDADLEKEPADRGLGQGRG